MWQLEESLWSGNSPRRQLQRKLKLFTKKLCMAKTEKAQTSADQIKELLDIGLAALRSVRNGVTHSLVQAIEMIAECQGQVLVTGVGKSCIIAQKIASTFRSTGTPATFLHAGDALHGDLGIVQSQDVLLAIGKSGETAEL